MPYRIVHCADVHLETTFAQARGGTRRRKALADAFVRIVDAALEKKADALTIGGDLYEHERAGPQTARFLFEQFARFGKPVFIATGNHDPHSPGSLLARGDLPDNVRVFNEAAWRAYPLADELVLYGFGHTPAEPGRPFARARFERDGVCLAMVHGSDEGNRPPNKRATAPFTKDEIAASGATFVLTGHYHGGYVAEHGGTPLYAYPGSPEPIKFGESAVHGALLVTVEQRRVHVAPLPTARTRTLDVRCDLRAASSEHAVFERIERTLGSYGRDDYVRLTLYGQIAHGTRVDPTLLEERFGETLGSLSIEDETVAHDYASIAREPTVRGHVVRDLLDAGDDGAAALRYALAAFDGTEIVP